MPSLFKRGIALILTFLFLLTPLKSYAHDAYFFQVLIDTNNYAYQGNILEDSASTILNRETAHIEAELGDFRGLIKDNYNDVPVKDYQESKVDTEDYLPFTFSPMEAGDKWFDGKSVNHATQEDADRAYTIKDTLIPGLNDALRILNGGRKFKDVKALIEMSNKLASAIRQAAPSGTVTITGYDGNGSSKTYTIRVGQRASYSKPEDDLKNGIMNNDYLVIFDGENEYEFVYRMEKGYKEQGKWQNNVYRNNLYNLTGDTKYITWNMIMYQGVYAYQVKGYTTKNGNEVAKPGALEEAVAGLLENLFNGIRNLLGLYSMNELIYNDGIRGSKAWYYGALPMSWEQNVMQYHLIFQALAWSLIVFAIIKALIQRNLATINPSMRVSLIEQIKDLLLTGVILSFTMPVIDLFLMFNNKLVDIFGAVAVDLDDLSGLNNYTNLLAGILLQFFYLFISIYLNFVYIIRAITIAILTAMAPLFIVTLAFGGRWKGLFGQWMRELLANIFLQSFHAFILAFLFLSSTSSRGIEVLVICFAVLPLTEFFRGLILGQAGGIAGMLGMKTIMAGADVLTANSRKTIGQKRVQESDEKTSSKSASTSTTSNGGVSEAGKLKSSERFNTSSATASSASDPIYKTPNQHARQTMMEKEIPIKDLDRMQSDPAGIEKDHGTIMDAKDAKIKDFMQNIRDIDYVNIGKKGAGAIAGAAMMATGAGFALAFGGLDKGAAKEGADIIAKGAKVASPAAKSIASTTSRIGGAVGVNLNNRVVKPAGQKIASAFGMGSATGGASSTAVDLPPASGGYMPQHSFIEGGENGSDFILHREGADQYGVVKAYDDPINSNHAKIHYDISKLNAVDRNNLKYYASVFTSEDREQQNWLRRNGIENVGFNRKNELIVTYNQVGKEKLGFKSIQTTNDGRIIERKANNASLQTRLTVDVPPPPIGLQSNRNNVNFTNDNRRKN